MRKVNFRQSSRNIASLFCFIVVPVSTQGAALITQSFNLPAESEVIGPTNLDLTADPFDFFQLTVDQFDSSLGTLQSIDYSYDLDFTASRTVDDASGACLAMVALGATLFGRRIRR